MLVSFFLLYNTRSYIMVFIPVNSNISITLPWHPFINNNNGNNNGNKLINPFIQLDVPFF